MSLLRREPRNEIDTQDEEGAGALLQSQKRRKYTLRRTEKCPQNNKVKKLSANNYESKKKNKTWSILALRRAVIICCTHTTKTNTTIYQS